MSFLHTQRESVVMKEFLKPFWLSQLFPKPRAEAPDGAIHYLTEKKRKRKGKQGLRGRKMGKTDDISNLYPLNFLPNYKVPIAKAAETKSM